MTPHLEAAKGDYAETVLLPGDPQRAEWIAENFLSDARCVSNLRAEPGFTGSWRGLPDQRPVDRHGRAVAGDLRARAARRLSRAHADPHRHVRRAVRQGRRCAAWSSRRRRAATARSTASFSSRSTTRLAPISRCLRLAADCAKASGVTHFVGQTMSSDVFYHPDGDEAFRAAPPAWRHRHRYGDQHALHAGGAVFRPRAVDLTVVDNMVTGEETALSERQELFRPMVELALEVASGGWRADLKRCGLRRVSPQVVVIKSRLPVAQGRASNISKFE